MRYLSFFIVLVLFSGCMKNYNMDSAKIITIRSPLIKYSDLGYVRGHGDDLKIELYEMGNVVKSIYINHFICVDDGCMLKSAFNKKYLNENYPSDILENVITGRAIYDGKNMRKLYNGYVQDIEDKNVDIDYEVSNDTIRFRDRRNGILLKISNPDKNI